MDSYCDACTKYFEKKKQLCECVFCDIKMCEDCCEGNGFRKKDFKMNCKDCSIVICKMCEHEEMCNDCFKKSIIVLIEIKAEVLEKLNIPNGSADEGTAVVVKKKGRRSAKEIEEDNERKKLQLRIDNIYKHERHYVKTKSVDDAIFKTVMRVKFYRQLNKLEKENGHCKEEKNIYIVIRNPTLNTNVKAGEVKGAYLDVKDGLAQLLTVYAIYGNIPLEWIVTNNEDDVIKFMFCVEYWNCNINYVSEDI